MPSEEKNKKDDIVLLSHGAGGSLQEKLIQFITKSAKIRDVNKGIGLDAFDDGATIPLDNSNSNSEIVITADGHTISPLFFPGGNLGILSAAGTINDLIMMGARPIAISSVVFIEEGFSFETLGQITSSFNDTLAKNGVALLCGDTKVLPKGNLDKMIMATTGIGTKSRDRLIADSNAQPGDKIIVTGSIGDHGAAIIANRKEINLKTDLKSDVAVLLPIFEKIKNFKGIHAMKDPTRGGLATALNDWAKKSKVGITLKEETVPIRKEVRAISEILGLNPYEISNEGKAIISVDPNEAEAVLAAIKTTEIGKNAAIIGEISKDNAGKVLMKTKFGGTRFIETPLGEPIPRVC